MTKDPTPILTLRLRTGLSQTAFGRLCGGVPLRTIQNWESGVRVPPPYVVKLIEFRVDHYKAPKMERKER